MSKSLTTNAAKIFEDEVKAAYQGSGKLRRRVRVKSNVRGSQYQFHIYSKGVAQQKLSSQSDVTPMGLAHTNQTATLTNWVAPEFTDIFDQAEVPYDERGPLTDAIGKALSRREDQLIIDALDATSTTNTVSTDIGGTGTNLNTAKLRSAKGLLDANGVPADQRCFVGSTDGLNNGLLALTDVTSSDFNTVKALVNGEINTWLGFDYDWIETRTEGGLPLSSGARTNFAFHMLACGLAIGIDMRTEVNYVPIKTSWLACGIFKAGSVAIDDAGIVEMTTTET